MPEFEGTNEAIILDEAIVMAKEDMNRTGANLEKYLKLDDLKSNFMFDIYPTLVLTLQDLRLHRGLHYKLEDLEKFSASIVDGIIKTITQLGFDVATMQYIRANDPGFTPNYWYDDQKVIDAIKGGELKEYWNKAADEISKYDSPYADTIERYENPYDRELRRKIMEYLNPQSSKSIEDISKAVDEDDKMLADILLDLVFSGRVTETRPNHFIKTWEDEYFETGIKFIESVYQDNKDADNPWAICQAQAKKSGMTKEETESCILKLKKKFNIVKNEDDDGDGVDDSEVTPENNPWMKCRAEGKEKGWSKEEIEACIEKRKKAIQENESEDEGFQRMLANARERYYDFWNKPIDKMSIEFLKKERDILDRLLASSPQIDRDEREWLDELREGFDSELFGRSSKLSDQKFSNDLPKELTEEKEAKKKKKKKDWIKN